LKTGQIVEFNVGEGFMSGSKRIALALVAVALAAVWLWLLPPRWWLNLIKPVDLSDPVQAGMAVVEEYRCRQCHFIGDAGKVKGPALVGVTERLDSVSLRLWLRDPRAIKWRTSMPNFDLSDGEIEAIVAYLTALDTGGS
jgi:nitric oxide reductase subunit C